MNTLKNITGEVFGRLTVITQLANENGRATWYCKCSCGGSKIIDSKALRIGKTASCGCLRSKHGLSKTHPLYSIWISMRSRCNNPNDISYCYYGKRGIAVCARWDNFELFLQDMGPRPPKTSIGRDDNNGNYEPDNCRWATAFEQGQNTSRTRLITAGGKTQTITEWTRHLGGEITLIHNRLARGWTEEKACLTPIQTDWRSRKIK